MYENKFEKQANNIWSMLDEMDASDPEHYKKFIQKNLQEGKEYFAPPKESMCLETTIISTKEEKTIYINVMEWSKIQDSKSDEDPIFISGGKLYEEENCANCLITSVAFNPAILSKYGQSCKSLQERNMLIYLAFEYIESYNKFKLKKAYKTLKISLKGKLSNAINSIYSSLKDKSNVQLKEDIGKSTNDQLISSIIKEINDKDSSNNDNDIQTLSLQNETIRKKPLIEEIEASNIENTNVLLYSKPSKNVELNDDLKLYSNEFENYERPKYLLKRKENVLIMEITIPGVASVSDCQLDISPTDLILIVKDKYYLSVNFEVSIVPESTDAEFSKKKEILSVTMPI